MGSQQVRAPMIGASVQFVRGDLIRAATIVRVQDALTVNLQCLVDGDVPPVWEVNVKHEAEVRAHNAKRVGFPIAEFWRWPR